MTSKNNHEIWGNRKLTNKNYQEDGLYKGTIKVEQANSSTEHIHMPGRTNPYQYYHLPPDYYYWMKKQNKNIPIINVAGPTRGQKYLPEDQEMQSRQPHLQAKTTASNVTNHNDRNKDKRNRFCFCKNQIRPETTKHSDKLSKGDHLKTRSDIHDHATSRAGNRGQLHKVSTSSNQPERSKLKRKENNMSEAAIKFPAVKPESEQGLTRITSFETNVFNPLYKESRGLMFSPLVPAAIEDYPRSLPVKRVTPKTLIPGNPLIPVMIPAEKATNMDHVGSRYSPVSSAFYVDEEDDYDAIYRRYADIPSYNAVGWVLNETEF